LAALPSLYNEQKMLSTAAAKERMFSSAEEDFSLAAGSCFLETRISARTCRGKKPHQGVAGKNAAPHQGSADSKPKKAHLVSQGWTGEIASGPTIYLYDGPNSIEEVDGNGNELARYSQGAGIDLPLAQVRAGTASFYQQDVLGSVTSLSSTTGTLANTYTFDAFGKLVASTGSLGNPFQYTGRDFDPETGLRYYRARYYDSASGRFLSEDPLSFLAGGTNFYSYVGNDPADFWDPLGLRRLTKCEKKALQPYIPQVDLDNADIEENKWPPPLKKFIKIPIPFLRAPMPKDVAAITLGNTIYVAPDQYDAMTPQGLALLGHELVHVGQYRTGVMNEAKYLLELIKHGSGLKNKYERPAYDMGDEIDKTLPDLLDELQKRGMTCGCEKQ
jgi:RHS repeat-associated protein